MFYSDFEEMTEDEIEKKRQNFYKFFAKNGFDDIRYFKILKDDNIVFFNINKIIAIELEVI